MRLTPPGKPARLLALWISAAALAACGGGSGAAPSAGAPQSDGSAGGGSGASSTGSVVIDASKSVATISRDEVGTSLAIWYDVTTSSLPGQVASIAPRIIRWPGGSISDTYHWQNQTECNTSNNQSGAAWSPNSTFDNFMNDVAVPGNYDVAITTDYGSNPACTGGGDPNEAAAWVAYAKSKGWSTYIRYWTVGNEEFGSWEYDLHSKPHDPATYAAAVSGSGGYYALMKAADPNAQVGVVVQPGPDYGNWDSVVLSSAPYDFVELHYYPQNPGKESDSYLLDQAPQDLTKMIGALRNELAAAGKPNTPIMLGELNSVSSAPGKQSMSIVNALFAGMSFGEALNDDLAAATWWIGAGGGQGCGNNDSAALYGWQDFGGYDLVAAGTWNGCGSGPVVPDGTLFPSGNAFSLVSQFAQAGQSMLSVSVGSSLPNVRAYAATLKSGGYAAMLFNLDETAGATLTLSVVNSSRTSFSATTLTYDRQLYDQSQSNAWPGPVTASLGTTSATTTLTLPPWSMTVLQLQ